MKSPTVPAHHRNVFNQFSTDRGIRLAPLSYLSHGANNQLYRCNINGNDAVCKIGTNSSYRHLATEYNVLTALRGNHRTILDYYYHGDSHTELLIQPYHHGKHLFTLNNNALVHLGKAIASYHSIAPAIPGLRHHTAASFFYECIPLADTTPFNKQYGKQFRSIHREVSALCASLPAHTPSAVPTLIHGDLIPLNIIFGEDYSVTLIDWEGARLGTPEADLVTCIKAFHLTATEVQQLLDAYGRPIDPATLTLYTLLHYIQVVAWRLTVQLKREQSDTARAAIESTLTEEFTVIEHILGQER